MVGAYQAVCFAARSVQPPAPETGSGCESRLELQSHPSAAENKTPPPPPRGPATKYKESDTPDAISQARGDILRLSLPRTVAANIPASARTLMRTRQT